TPDGSRFPSVSMTPRNQWKVQSYLNISKTVQFDAFAFTQSSVITPDDYGVRQLDPHTRVDLRLGWKISAMWELSLSGQDLLSARHLELTPEAFTPAVDAVRGYYLKSIWRF